jgi:hypothetical protein
MRPAMLVLLTVFVVTQAHAQADSTAPDVFHKVADSARTSSSGNDVFRRAAQAKEAAENRPDVIATDPNQVEAQVVRRDSVAILHRAAAVAAAPAPVPAPTPSATPVSPSVAALGAAFTAAGPPDDPKSTVTPAVTPTVTPKARRAPVANGSIAKKAPAPEPTAPPVEHATVVAAGAAPMPTRMGAMPAPAAPPQAVFNDTLTTLQREAASVSQDVAPRYATQKAAMDSVRNKHNARLDSLEATESTIKDSTERRFEHKMAEAARLKNGKPQPDSSAKQH